MERYESYKDSGAEWIGEIPDGWSLCRLDSFFHERNETVSDKDFAPLSVSMKGVLPQLEYVAKTNNNDGRKLVRRGDFAINSRSDRRGACGFSDRDGSVSVITTVLEPRRSSALSADYFGALLSSYGFSNEFYRVGHGIVADLWSTKWPQMKLIQIPVPTIADQIIISAWLGAKTAAIDGYIDDTERSIDLLAEYRRSVISEVVTKGLDSDAPMRDSGVEWIGEIPEGWHVAKLCFLGDSILGQMLDQSSALGECQSEYLTNRNIRWFSFDTENLGTMAFSDEATVKYQIHDGDVLICEGGEVGKCAVWHGPTPGFFFQKAIHRFRPYSDKCDPDYIAYQLFQKASTTNFGEVRKGESTIAHLTGEQLARLRMVVPPLAEQREIASYLDAKTAEIDSLVADKRRLVERLREYRASLVSEAVTGKFKVPGVA